MQTSNQVLIKLAAKIAFVRERKALYVEFSQSGYLPLPLQPRWLDALCTPEHRDPALVTDGGGAMIAAIPWYKKRCWGLWVIQLPPLGTYAGPWLRYPMEPNFKLQRR